MKWLIPALLSATQAQADPMLIEDFTDGQAPDWQYVSDRVMGGVSNGVARFLTEDGKTFARLEGEVSTANNGGFIQMRRVLTNVPDTAEGLALTLRGNGARYFVHLRPEGVRRPWQYYQAAFDTTGEWQDVTLGWEDFAPNGGLTGTLDPAKIRSLGIVAYGENYTAQLDVARVEAR